MVTLKDTISTISNIRRQRLLAADGVLRKAVEILVVKYKVKKIILVGSFADKSRFSFHSDIDLCVEGLPDKLYFKAAGELLMLSDEFDIDIIPFENIPLEKKREAKKGRLLYEKR